MSKRRRPASSPPQATKDTDHAGQLNNPDRMPAVIKLMPSSASSSGNATGSFQMWAAATTPTATTVTQARVVGRVGDETWCSDDCVTTGLLLASVLEFAWISALGVDNCPSNGKLLDGTVQ